MYLLLIFLFFAFLFPPQVQSSQEAVSLTPGRGVGEAGEGFLGRNCPAKEKPIARVPQLQALEEQGAFEGYRSCPSHLSGLRTCPCVCHTVATRGHSVSVG